MSLKNHLLQYQEAVPAWLSRFNAMQTFDPTAFFQSRVVFYPNAGYDDSAVKAFGESHAAHCFLYVDYGRSKADVMRELNGHGFSGYRNLDPIDLSPDQINPWQWHPHLGREDLQPGQYLAPTITPFGFLQILERQENLDDSYGAERLAVLFLGADGVATYDALFAQSGQQPPFAAVLQDHGYGGNYTSFGNGGLLEKVAIRSGKLPRFLWVGEGTPAWDGYQQIPAIDGANGGEWAQHMRFLFQKSDDLDPTTQVIDGYGPQIGADMLMPTSNPAMEQQQEQIAWNDANREFYLGNNSSFVERYSHGGPGGNTLTRLYQRVATEFHDSVLTDARLVVKRLSELMPNAVHASTGIGGDHHSVWLLLGMIAPDVNTDDGRLSGQIHGTTRIGLTCIGGQIFLVLRQMQDNAARPDLLNLEVIPEAIRSAAFDFIRYHLRPEGQHRQQRRVHLPLNPINGGFSVHGQPLREGSALCNFLLAVDAMYRDHVFTHKGKPVAASHIRRQFLEDRQHYDGHPCDVIYPALF